MRAALALHYARLQQQAGIDITYTDGTTTVSLVAVRTRPRSLLIDVADNVMISSKSWDWLINKTELGLDPSLGHKITDDEGVEYSVKPSGSGDNCWRWSDGQHTFIRVHTEER